MKVALVHDYLNQMGGAERVVLALHEMFPDAPLYTSIYDAKRVDTAIQSIDIRTSFMQRFPLVKKHHQPLLPFFISGLRIWDQTSSLRVDYFIANSPVVADRIRKYYRRDSVVIPPPVEVSRFTFDSTTRLEDYFLIVSRFMPYKRIDLAIEACNLLQLPLVIIGSGRDENRLKRLA